MADIKPPKYVKQVLIGLQSRGHLAFLVGGCVRDMILGVHPQDWDICTSALPEQTMEIFEHTVPTGVRHGTVTVMIGSKGVEVTTFRSDGSYADHRHPEGVRFVGELTTDLSRRDFTMNAIALSADGMVVDPYGGIDDISRKCIRAVGVPAIRFEEDALRMFRALRFSARLGFVVDESTMAAIYEKAPLASALAAERVRDEVEKMLLTKHPEMLQTVISAGLLDRYLLRRVELGEGLKKLASLPKKALYRWAGLCALLERYDAVPSGREFVTSLRLDGRTARCCGDCCTLLRRSVPQNARQWKHYLNDYGVDSCECAARCQDALHTASGCYAALHAVIKSGECFSIRHLAVNGDDLSAAGLRGKELGEMLHFLLDYVIDHPENNRRELLLSLVSATEEN